MIFDGQATKNLNLYPLEIRDMNLGNPLWDEFESELDHSQPFLTLGKAQYFKNEMEDGVISGCISNSLFVTSIEDSGLEDVVEDLILE